MRYGIIDVGSNTIRGVVYEYNGKKAVKVEDRLVKSHILWETNNRNLSNAGVNRLIAVLNKLKYVLLDSGCEKIGCFATYSIRSLENADYIKEVILTTTGIDLIILSGEEEAEYDFIALRSSVPEHSAIGLDLGGGSCQITQFEYNRLLFAQSYTIGSNRLKSMFVSNELPNKYEREKIEKYVVNELAGIKNIFGSRYLYAMGGTAKCALKLYNSLNNAIVTDDFLSRDKLNMLIRAGDSNPAKIYEMYSQVARNRADTIVPGMVILRTICDILEVEGIYVLQCSVRDGFLYRMIKEDVE